MTITHQDLLDQNNKIQNDLENLLDGMGEDVIAPACQIVAERFQILIDKLDAPLTTGLSPKDETERQAISSRLEPHREKLRQISKNRTTDLP